MCNVRKFFLTCCKAVFSSSLGPCRRSHGLDDRTHRRYVLESIGNKLNLDGLAQTKSKKSLCNRWVQVRTATPVNAKGLRNLQIQAL